ncbi:MAG: YaiI/YqxD family protein [Gammaproteobacteria bacterium]
MRIWVDADACPAAVREILFRAAARTRILTTLVANAAIRVPASPWIAFRRVARGFDEADRAISAALRAGDLVITADIPLAADAVGRGAFALNPRGELYTRENVRELLNMRDFMDTLRGSGIRTGGPPPMTPADRKAFADALDRFLAGRTPGP